MTRGILINRDAAVECPSMLERPQPDEGLLDLKALEQAAECLRTLAHAHRLRMIEMLLKDRYTVGELAKACGILSNTASEHLRLLMRCGMLAPHREGRRTYYQVSEPHLADIMACVKGRFGSIG
jgi:ArsR family transcriptional regulator, zinc-responsive transcriptional repressor